MIIKTKEMIRAEVSEELKRTDRYAEPLVEYWVSVKLLQQEELMKINIDSCREL